MKRARSRRRYEERAVELRERERLRRASLSPEQRARQAQAQRDYRRRVGYLPCKREGDQRRRARKLAAFTEVFHNVDIFERDGWRCGICRRKVDPELVWPDPKSASLDHIEPLSLGGSHTAANVRLAHLACNVKRGDRLMDEQLAMVG